MGDVGDEIRQDFRFDCSCKLQNRKIWKTVGQSKKLQEWIMGNLVLQVTSGLYDLSFWTCSLKQSQKLFLAFSVHLGWMIFYIPFSVVSVERVPCRAGQMKQHYRICFMEKSFLSWRMEEGPINFKEYLLDYPKKAKLHTLYRANLKSRVKT